MDKNYCINIIKKNLNNCLENILNFYSRDVNYSIEYSEWAKEKSTKNSIVYFNRNKEVIKRPRKCLNWKTPHEAFMEELSHLA